MKKLLFVLISLYQLTVLTAQKNQLLLHIDSFYQDRNEYLIKSEVIIIDSLSNTELIKRIKNWGGINFVNLKEVLVSETEDQLVFNYISNKYSVLNDPVSWNVRLVVQIKQNKIRLLFYDDGNGFIKGYYSAYASVPSIAARTFKFKNYFYKDDKTIAAKMYSPGLINFKKGIDLTITSLSESIKTTEININKKDDW